MINTASKYYGVYGTTATINENGAETPFSPTVTANAGAAYTFHLDQAKSGLTMTSRFDVSYRTDSYANLFHNPSTLLAGGFLVNASLNFAQGPWTASVWATNLLNRITREPSSGRPTRSAAGSTRSGSRPAPPSAAATAHRIRDTRVRVWAPARSLLED